MRILIFLLQFLLLAKIGIAQTDTTTKSLKTNNRNAIFRNAAGQNIDNKKYIELANSGLYEISYSIELDSSIIYSLDSTNLLKLINTKLKSKIFKSVTKKNKLNIITFWNSKCKPCIEEIDSLNILVSKYRNVNFSALTTENRSELINFLKAKTFLYNIFYKQDILKDKLYITAFPTHILIDKDMQVREIIVGSSANTINVIETFIDTYK